MKRGFETGSVMLAALCCATLVFAGGDPNYILYVADGAGAQPAGGGLPGESFTSTVYLDSSLGGNVQGWSFGVCSDPAILSVDSTALGAASLIVNNGAEVEFEQQAVLPGGATFGVVICFTGCATLAPATDSALLDIGYTILGTTDTTLDICDTLGTPPVSSVIVVNGNSIPPTRVAGIVDVVDPNQLVAGNANGLLGSTTDTTISLNNDNLPAVDAVQVALAYDSAIISVNGVNNDVGAEFFDFQDDGAGAIVVGLVQDTSDPIDQQIPAGPSMTDLFTITWNGDAVGTSALTFTDGLGTPPINNGVISGQNGLYQPSLINGSVNIVNFNPFLRSDCNFDGIVNIADGVYGLNFLFQGGPTPTCDDACDSNDDATIDAADCIYIFNFQFLEGPAPQAPYPTADLDPTPGDGLGCNGDADDL